MSSFHKEDYVNAVESVVEYVEAHPWLEIVGLVVVSFLLGRCTA